MPVLLICLHWPIISLGGTADELGWAHFILLLILPIYSLGPITSLSGAANELGWAHFQCCRFTCLGSLFLLNELPMHSGRPIAAAANLLALAHYFFGRSAQCTQMGLFHFSAASANYSIKPIISLSSAADELRWSHCQCCLQYLLALAHYFFERHCR